MPILVLIAVGTVAVIFFVGVVLLNLGVLLSGSGGSSTVSGPEQWDWEARGKDSNNLFVVIRMLAHRLRTVSKLAYDCQVGTYVGHYFVVGLKEAGRCPDRDVLVNFRACYWPLTAEVRNANMNGANFKLDMFVTEKKSQRFLIRIEGAELLGEPYAVQKIFRGIFAKFSDLRNLKIFEISGSSAVYISSRGPETTFRAFICISEFLDGCLASMEHGDALAASYIQERLAAPPCLAGVDQIVKTHAEPDPRPIRTVAYLPDEVKKVAD
ncbi:MAG: hypothetical protein ACK43M_11615 [Allorhizobium sp.]